MEVEKLPIAGKPNSREAKSGSNNHRRLIALQSSGIQSDKLLHTLIASRFDVSEVSKNQQSIKQLIGAKSALANDKNHSIVGLYSAYVNLRVNSGIALEETFSELSDSKDNSLHLSILQNLFNFDLLDLSDYELIEIFTLLGILLQNNHIEVASTWIGMVFCNNIWRKLSKLYLRSLLSTYNGYIDQYAAVSKKKLSQVEESAAEFLLKTVTLFSHKFESISFNLSQNEISVCEKILEFFLVALSTPQSRLATVQLMQDKQFYIKNSMFLRYVTAKEQKEKETTKNPPELENLWQILTLIKRFVNYGMEGESKIARRTMMVHYDTFQEFQRLLFHHFGDKVANYVVKSVGNLDNREKMTEIFSYLDENDLRLIASKLHIFIPEDDDSDPVLSILTEQQGFKPIIEEILIYNLRATESILNRVKRDPLYPTQRDIWLNPNRIYHQEDTLKDWYVSGVDLRQTFPVDRITTSFVNIEDYLIRYFYVWKHQSALECRELLEECVRKVSPEFDPLTGVVKEFAGWSSESLEIKNFTIYDVEKPKIGKTVPERILAEIYYSTVDIMSECKARWEVLREYETLFLLSFNKRQSTRSRQMENELDQPDAVESGKGGSFLDQSGLIQVRGARLISHMDEDRKKINVSEFRSDVKAYGTSRYLQIHLDPNQYNIDTTTSSREKAAGVSDSVFSLVVKRATDAPNYLNYMNLILKFLESGRDLPTWINSVVTGKRYNNGMYMPRKKEESAPIKVAGIFESADEQTRVLQAIPSLKNYPQDFEFESSSGVQSIKRKWNSQQKQVILSSTYPGVVLVSGCVGTGKTELVSEIILQNLTNYPEERILIVSRCEVGISLIAQSLARSGKVQEDILIRLGSYDQINASKQSPEVDGDSLGDFTKYGRVNYMLKLRLEMLSLIQKIANDINPDLNPTFTCETAEIFLQSQVLSRYTSFVQDFTRSQQSEAPVANLPEYPFGKLNLTLAKTADRTGSPLLAQLQDKSASTFLEICQQHFETEIQRPFAELAKTRVLELLRVDKERGSYLLNYHSKVIMLTPETLLEKHEELFELKHQIGTLIIDEAQQITDFESFAALAVAKSLNKVILLGDPLHEPPNIKNPILKDVSSLNKSMFERLRILGYPLVKLTQHYSYHPSLSTLCKVVSRDEELTRAEAEPTESFQVPGIKHNLQFLQLDRSVETSPETGRTQNLAEAEFAVALFIYLVLSGANPKHITILASEPGQVGLIEEIILVKASWHKSLGRPYKVTTFEKYQGQRNQIVILSFVRSDSAICQKFSTGKYRKRFCQALTAATHASFVLASENWYSCGCFLETSIAGLNRVEKGGKYKHGRLSIVTAGGERQIQDSDALYESVKALIPSS